MTTQETKKNIWERQVKESCRHICANCGGTDKLSVRLIVPIEAGGQFIESNGTLLCRPCEMAMESFQSSDKDSTRRPINFWVSTKLYNKLHNGLRDKYGFQSIGSLVRYLITKYVNDADRFEDLLQYQSSGSDLKVNVWVDSDSYIVFKAIAEEHGMTVTDAIKSLISIYENEAESLLKSR